MLIAKIGRRGQMTLPSAICDGCNIREGDHIAFIRRGNEYVLQPLGQTLLDHRGSVCVSGVQDFEKIRESVPRGLARKNVNDAS
jgi:AbrB family looped-hinge helix DNA binding protein